MKSAISLLTLLVTLGWGAGTAVSAQEDKTKEQTLQSMPTVPLKPKLIKPKQKATVPEPGTLLLVGSGLLGMAGWRKLRAQK